MRVRRPRRGFSLFEAMVCLLLVTIVSSSAYFGFSALYRRDDVHRTTQMAQAYERRVRELSKQDAGALANPLRNANAAVPGTQGQPGYSPLRAAESGFTAGVAVSGISSSGASPHLDDGGKVTLSFSRSQVCIDFTSGGATSAVNATSVATISDGACA